MGERTIKQETKILLGADKTFSSEDLTIIVTLELLFNLTAYPMSREKEQINKKLKNCWVLTKHEKVQKLLEHAPIPLPFYLRSQTRIYASS